MARRCSTGEAIVLRAWQASVMACLVFPLLAIYSLYLCGRLDIAKTPIGRAGAMRLAGALLFSLFALAACLLFVAAILMLDPSFTFPVLHRLGDIMDLSRGGPQGSRW